MIDENMLSWYHPKTDRNIPTQERLYNEYYPDGQFIHFGTVLNYPEIFDITKKSLKDYATKTLFECEEKHDVFSLIDDFFDKGNEKFIIDLKRREEMQILRRLIFEYTIIEKNWTRLRVIPSTNEKKTAYMAECDSVESAREFTKKYIYDRGFSVSSLVIIDIVGKKRFLPQSARPESDSGYTGKYLNKITSVILNCHQEISDFVKGVKRTDFGKRLMDIRNGIIT